MKNLKAIGFILIISAVAIGCANPVYVQKDESANLAKYRTYSWVETRDNKDNNKSATAFAEIGVHNAVNTELASQGWKEVTSNPDVLLSYDILVERATQQESSPVYSQPFTRFFYNPYFRRWGTIYYPSQFLGYETNQVPVRQGTITITMIDPNTDKSVWQAWTTKTIDYGRLTSDEIASAVHSIFKKFGSSK